MAPFTSLQRRCLFKRSRKCSYEPEEDGGGEGAGLPAPGEVLAEVTGVCADRDDVILWQSHLGDGCRAWTQDESDCLLHLLLFCTVSQEEEEKEEVGVQVQEEEEEVGEQV